MQRRWVIKLTLRLMKNPIRSLLALGIVSLLAVASARADSLTTVYGANNSGSLGGALYFDATIGANALSITGFDINTASTMSFTNFQVWILVGMTAQGNETSGSWMQVATGSGTGAGLNNPTMVSLSSMFTLNANTLYGFALVADPAFGQSYTMNGNGTTQNYSNADLALSLGSFSPIFRPRVWNGTIYYDVVSEIPETGSTLALLGISVLGLIGLGRRQARLVQTP